MAGLKIAIAGDFNPRSETHAATGAALEHCAAKLGIPIGIHWFGTQEIEAAGAAPLLNSADGVVIAPGSPYRSMAGALAASAIPRMPRMPNMNPPRRTCSSPRLLAP